MALQSKLFKGRPQTRSMRGTRCGSLDARSTRPSCGESAIGALRDRFPANRSPRITVAKVWTVDRAGSARLTIVRLDRDMLLWEQTHKGSNECRGGQTAA